MADENWSGLKCTETGYTEKETEKELKRTYYAKYKRVIAGLPELEITVRSGEELDANRGEMVDFKKSNPQQKLG